jgi:hypothetical protein
MKELKDLNIHEAALLFAGSTARTDMIEGCKESLAKGTPKNHIVTCVGVDASSYLECINEDYKEYAEAKGNRNEQEYREFFQAYHDMYCKFYSDLELELIFTVTIGS